MINYFTNKPEPKPYWDNKSINFRQYINDAVDSLNKGFTSKAQKINAMQRLNSCYARIISDRIHTLMLQTSMTDRNDNWNELYWSLPHNLCHWKQKHSESCNNYPVYVNLIEECSELREVIKNTEVVPPIKLDSPIDRKIKQTEQSIKDKIKRDEIRYNEQYSLIEEFKGLKVYASSHWGMNSHGTSFIRTFYYLNGRLTALNWICALHGKHKEEYPELYPDKEVN